MYLNKYTSVVKLRYLKNSSYRVNKEKELLVFLQDNYLNTNELSTEIPYSLVVSDYLDSHARVMLSHTRVTKNVK